MDFPHLWTAEEWDERATSQLRMEFESGEAIPSERSVSGYAFRTYRPGDEDVWVAILNRCDFGDWDRDRLQRMLEGERAPLPRESIIFAIDEAGRAVGVANAFLWDGTDGTAAELGWVGVLPAHRGRGLSYEICRLIMEWAWGKAINSMFLTTEDRRLAAIKTYLRLGFTPRLTHDDQVERWDRLRHVLGVD